MVRCCAADWFSLIWFYSILVKCAVFRVILVLLVCLVVCFVLTAFWELLSVRLQALSISIHPPAGWLGLLAPCSRAPHCFLVFVFFFWREREEFCLSTWTPAGLKFSWWSSFQVSYICLVFLSFTYTLFLPSFLPLPHPVHFISHEATHLSASRYSWRRLWMCLTVSHHPSLSYTDADGHRA